MLPLLHKNLRPILSSLLSLPLRSPLLFPLPSPPPRSSSPSSSLLHPHPLHPLGPPRLFSSASKSIKNLKPSPSPQNMTGHGITIDLSAISAVPVRGPVDLSNYENFTSIPEEPLGKAWENHKAIVFIIRRLGCPVCRAGALLLSSTRPQLDAHGIKLIGVTFQTGEELKAYLEGGYLKGDLYLDEKRATYEKSDSTGILGALKLIKSLITSLSSEFRGRMGRLTSNKKGIAAVVSSIIGIQDGKIVYEQKYVEEPNIPKILEALGIQGDDYQAALDSVKMNLEANGDELVGPACSIKNRTCA